MERDVFRHGHNQRDLGFNCLLDRSCSLVSRYVDGSSVRLELLCCLCVPMLVPDQLRRDGAGSADRADCGQHRKAQVLPGAAGCHTSNNICAPSNRVSGICRRLDPRISSWVH